MNVYVTYLKRKYPFDILNLKIILLISMLITLMIFCFTPFGFDTYPGNKFLASLGFGLTTFLSLLVSNKILKGYLLRINNKRWTILREIGYTILVLFLISLTNLTYFIFLFNKAHYFDSNDIFLWIRLLLAIIFCTLTIGVIPITGVILYRYNKMLKNSLSDIIRGIQKKKDSEIRKRLTFPSLNIKEEDISILLDEVLFMEAVKNHVYIYFVENGNVVKKSVRNTLTNIIEHLHEDALFKCHRSFLINLNRIKSAKGNSNGYRVLLQGYGPEIVVSRNFAPQFQKLIY